MRLFLCEVLHLATSLVVFGLVTRVSPVNDSWVLAGALLGGFLIDVDHIFDQLIVFGLDLSPVKLFKGGSFLYGDKAYIFFHGWEYVFLLLIAYWLLIITGAPLVWSTFILTLCLSMFGHLVIDSNTNHMSYQAYSFVYRISHNFDLEQLISPENWQDHLEQKKNIRLV